MMPKLTDNRRSRAELRPPEPVIQAGEAPTISDPPKWVLVVDDEPDVLESVADCVSRMLNSPRIRVRTARSGPEAIEMMAQQFFDLIITDFRRGTMDGVRLLEIARQMKPGVPCVIMSGDPVGASERIETLHAENLVFLRKPFDPAALESHAMDALGFGPTLQASSNAYGKR